MFDITYSWQHRDTPLGFNEEDYIEASPFFLAMEKFLATFDGEFSFHLGESVVTLDLDPDLAIVFEDLPAFLEGLCHDSEDIELYFCEQGTDIKLLASCAGDKLKIRFAKGLYPGLRFDKLPEKDFEVYRSVFLSKWGQFLTEVLDALLAQSPTLKKSEDYIRYAKQINAILEYSK